MLCDGVACITGSTTRNRRGRPRSCGGPYPARVPPSSRHAAQFVSSTRDLDLDKPPGVAETIDWVAALVALGVADLVAAGTERGMAGVGALAKTPDDYALISEAFAEYSSH